MARRAFQFAVVVGLLLPLLGIAAERETVRIPFGDIELSADLTQEEGADRPLFLLVHGTLAHKDMAIIETLQTALDEAGRDSLAISLSFGLNNRTGPYPCDVPHRHTQEGALEEIAAWARWLQAEGYSRISVVGHSRGAAHVAEYVLEHPHQIDHVTLIAPPRSFKARQTDSMADLQAEDGWLQDINFLHCENATVSEMSFASYYAADPADDLLEALGKTKTPLLVVSGSEDTVSTGLKEVAEEAENRHVSFVEIAGADHFFQDLYAYDVVDSMVLASKSVPHIALARSLAELGQEAREKSVPIVLFFSEPNCSYCHRLRQQVLLPMIGAGELQDDVILREISIAPEFQLRDFSGQQTDVNAFAEKQGLIAAPTLMFFAPGGDQIAEPIVGIQNIELYEHYLMRSLRQASQSLTAN